VSKSKKGNQEKCNKNGKQKRKEIRELSTGLHEIVRKKKEHKISTRED
jgi:hypothetical protein